MQPTNVTSLKFTLSPTNLVVPRCISGMIYALYVDFIVLISTFYMPLKSPSPMYQHLPFLC